MPHNVSALALRGQQHDPDRTLKVTLRFLGSTM